MTILQSVLLGIVQGLTEFLPISSSGHLVIVPYLLGWEIPPNEAFIFDVLVQVATLVAVFTYFWRDLIEITGSMIRALINKQPFGEAQARLGWYLFLATIPAGVFGLAFKSAIESAFSSPLAVSFFLLITAGLLIIAEKIGQRTRDLTHITWQDGLWIGFFQVLALFPGISRSGATITGGMTRDLERPPAARFSFLMSVPVMFAAGLVATLDLLETPNLGNLLPIYIPGFIAAAIVGYLAIRWLLAYLTQHPLYIFSIYCVLLSTLTLVVYLIK